MDIQEINGIEVVSCDDCGATGFLYEMKVCDCGVMIHNSCVDKHVCEPVTINFFELVA